MTKAKSWWQRGFGMIELTQYSVGLERPEFTPVERVLALVEAGSSAPFRVGWFTSHIKRLEGVKDFEYMTIDYNHLINLFSQKEIWTEEEIDNAMKEIVEATKVNIIKELFYIL
jgi:transcription-repair coupling factor (superfamily II helicase)